MIKVPPSHTLGPPTRVLQRGHSARRNNHKSMHARWNVCPQLSNGRTLSPGRRAQRHMEHSRSWPAGIVEAVTILLERVAISAAVRPWLGLLIGASGGSALTLPHLDLTSSSSTALMFALIRSRFCLRCQAVNPIQAWKMSQV